MQVSTPLQDRGQGLGGAGEPQEGVAGRQAEPSLELPTLPPKTVPVSMASLLSRPTTPFPGRLGASWPACAGGRARACLLRMRAAELWVGGGSP